jgi:hypothetical protein
LTFASLCTISDGIEAGRFSAPKLLSAADQFTASRLFDLFISRDVIGFRQSAKDPFLSWPHSGTLAVNQRACIVDHLPYNGLLLLVGDL